MGKTVLGIYLAAVRRRNVLILVHRAPLLDQWVSQLSIFLGVDGKQIGRIGGGNRKPTGKIDVAMMQSLVFLAAPISWKGTLTQYAGRLNRLHPGKQEVRIYDYVDAAVPMLARMFEKRLKTYRALGYSNNELTMKLG